MATIIVGNTLHLGNFLSPLYLLEHYRVYVPEWLVQWLPLWFPQLPVPLLNLKLSFKSSVKYSLGLYPFLSHVWSVAKSIRGSSILRSLFSSNISQRSAASGSVLPKSKSGYICESSFTSSMVSNT